MRASNPCLIIALLRIRKADEESTSHPDLTMFVALGFPFRLHLTTLSSLSADSMGGHVRLNGLRRIEIEMTRKLAVFAFASMVFGVVLSVASDAGKPVTVNGYVLDSACAFTKGLKKPISAQCAQACAKAGSPLVILSDNGTIYWPIADTTPSSGQNERLLPFAGQRVTASGKTYERGGSSAIVIEKIAAESERK
jgi:hypothetical protein